ncbi:hypothetical protein Ancab_000419 [Ancistrocladus abbreviatus]
MASSLYSFLIILAIVCYFVTPTFSTSRKALVLHKRARTGFRLELKHVDSGTNFTKFERIWRAVKRGKHRLHRLNAVSMTMSSSDTSNVETPVNVGDGEFLMTLAIGTPPESYSAIMDTGSDLIWTQCDPCDQCFDQPTPLFDPKKSSSYSQLSCSSDLCQQLPNSECSDGCQYLYSYGDDSSSSGVLAAETFTFGSVSVPNIGFGCGNDNQGSGFTQCSGLVGLGRGPLSLVSQLDEPKFSYCLLPVGETSKTSVLLMGSLANNLTNIKQLGDIKTTPLVQSSSQPSFYYVTLKGISVGDTRLPIDESTFMLNDDGSGGLILDSGTTVTYLEESAYSALRDELVSQINLTEADNSKSGLDLCFVLPSADASVLVPDLIFHFDGADLSLQSDNYLVGDEKQNLCLAMGSSSGMSILGNIQQQNFLVLYDLEKEKVSFIPTTCSEL